MRRSLVALSALSALSVVLSGCTGDATPTTGSSSAQGVAPGPAPAFKLVAFDSCEQLLSSLRAAAAEAVGPWGFGNGMLRGGGIADGRAADLAGGSDKRAAPPGQEFSGTNTHEAGVDEPDLVKTDGKRIVTLAHGSLKVIDAASRTVTGSLTLGSDEVGEPRAVNVGELLLAGDRALLLGADYKADVAGGPGVSGAQVTLVDLAGAPKVLGRFTIEGGLLDARQVGGTARVVVVSRPRIAFPDTSRFGTDDARIAANRSAVTAAPVDAWLPKWTAEDGAGKRTEGRVDCGAVSRPSSYSATAMLTVLTFDLGGAALGGGDPVSVVADGDTVYANGPSLYIANDQRWRVMADTVRKRVASPARPSTQVFRFDISGAGRPRFAASGEVPGWLLNQYSMSEWDGHLRIATTDSLENTTSSAVYVLRLNGGRLTEVGHVGGLGRSERIYSVRFIGTTGYVVTFRQTDPLYTLDLRDPAAPKVAGELKIPGYSAYLHPAGDGRLLGLGQDATEQGRVQGMQVSLFDVRDPARPARVAQHQRKGGSSEAEYDPHAFLYWAPLGLLAVPVWSDQQPSVLVLKVGDAAITEAGTITHPGRYTTIRRSLIVGGTLWTLSEQGLKATDAATLADQAWIAL
ncbi:beta-propeller domain-containing protein [Dactylosporangium aurantiacum]|uniref:Beta-propeller domain-containing protein n=1 Tax=Dactylosporangium aurantiacum TaxID=35754 RepID=A0A9Q9MD88_9ACTN|nr:beta-propeller domain-containing protein [Dactylosporangium aurantiacum]MDG6101135.1 beta-propeller domain-containing protein [Dactylosporangium aurantiacum]UWZ54833.1 beta-propeller domain-containing protein [Dactylosporangium aurantiacum]